MADEVIYVPLSKLRISEKNVRKQANLSDLNIEQLAAQIQAQTLLQNLVVVAARGGMYDIVDGKRRFLALQHLTKAMLLDLDREVPVKVVDVEDATSASLSAAFSQLPLHAVDQFEAFKVLIDEGRTVAQVASAFGIDEKAVQQRLKLASVAPAIVEAFRDEKISLEMLQAFTLTADQKRQLTVFKNMPAYGAESYRIQQVKGQLLDKAIEGSDPRARLIGETAYEAAGGATRKDLFSGDVFFEDPKLLDRMVDSKIFELEERVKAEGWSWVEVKRDGYWGGLEQRKPKVAPTTPEQDVELAANKARRDAIGRELSALRRSEPEDDYSSEYSNWEASVDLLESEHEALGDREQEIQAERASWSPKVKADAGAIIAFGSNGRLTVHRGLIDAKTAKRLAKVKEKAAATSAGGAEAEPSADLSDSLHQRLTAHRSSVLRLQVLKHRQAMLAVLAHNLVSVMLGHNWYGALAGLSGRSSDVHHRSVGVDLHVYPPHLEMAAVRDCLTAEIPDNEIEAFAWLLGKDEEYLLQLIASSVATSLSGIYSKATGASKPKLVDQLVEHLDIDMSDYWQADRASYLGSVPKALMVDAVTEVRGPLAGKQVGNMAKAEAAEAAELQLAGTRWLPAVIRRKRAPAPPSKPITQEEAVSHIQSLLEARKKRDADKTPQSAAPVKARKGSAA